MSNSSDTLVQTLEEEFSKHIDKMDSHHQEQTQLTKDTAKKMLATCVVVVSIGLIDVRKNRNQEVTAESVIIASTAVQQDISFVIVQIIDDRLPRSLQMEAR